jgi:hypothetical protein
MAVFNFHSILRLTGVPDNYDIPLAYR